MAAAPWDEPVSYCACTMRKVNLDGSSANTTCYLCDRLVPDDKAIYMVLKDHIRHLQLLGSKNKVKWKKVKKKNGRGPVMDDAIKGFSDREDIQKLLTKYETVVLCASIRVLVNNDSLKLRSLLSSSCEDFPPAVESKEVVDEEAAWEAEPEPTAEEAPPYEYLCEPKVAAGDDQETKDAEPEAIEEEYVEVGDMEEKHCEDDFPEPGHEPAAPEMEADPVEVCEASVEDTTPSDEEETGEERAQEKKDLIYLPFSIQHILMVHLQRILEGACFAYAQKRLPAFLRRRGWNCAEAVSLHTWMDQFSVIWYTFDTEPSRELLESVAEIEDAAVKRTPIDWSRTKKFLDNGVELTEVLQTEEYGDVIKRIRIDVTKAIQDLHHQEQKVRKEEIMELLQIYIKQDELNDREWWVKAEKEKKMRECQQSAGLKVIRTLDGAKVLFETSTS